MLSISVPPLLTVVPLSYPPAWMISVPPLFTTVPLAAPPLSTKALPWEPTETPTAEPANRRTALEPVLSATRFVADTKPPDETT